MLVLTLKLRVTPRQILIWIRAKKVVGEIFELFKCGELSVSRFKTLISVITLGMIFTKKRRKVFTSLVSVWTSSAIV